MIDLNPQHLSVFIANPYLWLFICALFSAVVLARLTTRIKKNIYQHTATMQKWRSIIINALFAGITGFIAFKVLNISIVQGHTALINYYLIVLLPAFILVRFVPQSAYLFVGFLFFSGIISFFVAKEWTMTTANSFFDSPIMGFYVYDNVAERTDLIILHEFALDVDSTALAKRWQEIAPLANYYGTFASYPKCPVEYTVRGYVMESRPEFFFFYPASYFYPLEFHLFNAKSNVSKEPKMAWYLRLMRFMTGFREVQWSFTADFPNNQEPTYLFAQTQKQSPAALTSAPPTPCRFYEDMVAKSLDEQES